MSRIWVAECFKKWEKNNALRIGHHQTNADRGFCFRIQTPSLNTFVQGRKNTKFNVVFRGEFVIEEMKGNLFKICFKWSNNSIQMLRNDCYNYFSIHIGAFLVTWWFGLGEEWHEGKDITRKHTGILQETQKYNWTQIVLMNGIQNIVKCKAQKLARMVVAYPWK